MDLLFSNISWQGRQLYIVKGSAMCPIYFSGFANQMLLFLQKVQSQFWALIQYKDYILPV